jgi:L-ascorbate metabolism protein UlaG (beta-lactamase superfamily)
MNPLDKFETDIIKTSEGDLAITFLGHGSLYMTFRGKSIYIDPFGEVADYSKLPKADLVLVTHDHSDHLDPDALNAIRTLDSRVVQNADAVEKNPDGTIMANGDRLNVSGISIEAVPAYNIQHKRPDGRVFHPKGKGNGYIVTFGNMRIYIGGDTENIPEMESFKNIDIAFLPMNLPYTMTPEMVAAAARSFKPKVLYPYHLGDTDASRLVTLLRDEKGIEIRLRRMS